MSTYGSYTMTLHQERMERLRRERERQRQERVRQEAQGVLDGVQHTLNQLTSHIAQHFGQDARKHSQELVSQAGQSLRSNPDQALTLARRAMAAAERGVEQTAAKAKNWHRHKTVAQEAVSILKQAVKSFCPDECIRNGQDKRITEAVRCLAEATTALKREDFSGATATAKKGQKIAQKVEEARRSEQEREAVRQEIVRGLRTVLEKMNFSVSPPRLKRNGESNEVVLTGMFPSGRKAEFKVALNGTVNYDFDGYQHRQCGKHLEEIRTQMEQALDADTQNISQAWKEKAPLQISKGSLDLPSHEGKHLRR